MQLSFKARLSPTDLSSFGGYISIFVLADELFEFLGFRKKLGF
jgi:hypothetical protein